jgi:hypothetical protein
MTVFAQLQEFAHAPWPHAVVRLPMAGQIVVADTEGAV